VAVLGSSAFSGLGTISSSLAYGVMTGPIAAWRPDRERLRAGEGEDHAAWTEVKNGSNAASAV
jgi:hypothetical protein